MIRVVEGRLGVDITAANNDLLVVAQCLGPISFTAVVAAVIYDREEIKMEVREAFDIR